MDRSRLERTCRLGYIAVMQDYIIGGLAIFWGVLILALRAEFQGFARVGGHGFRDADFLRVAVVVAGIAVIGAGLALVLVRAL